MSFKSPYRMFPWMRASREAAMETAGIPAYARNILGYGPIAYWPLWETAGLTAHCLVNPAQDGTYSGVTLADAATSWGTPCPFFDGINDYVAIYTAALNAAFNTSTGTMTTWAKLWVVDETPDKRRYFMRIEADGSNAVYHYKYESDPNRSFINGSVRNGETDQNTFDANTNWAWIVTTWDESPGTDSSRMYIYQGGGLVDSLTRPLTSDWIGALTPATCVIGDTNIASVNPMWGWLAEGILWDRPLSLAEIGEIHAIYMA